MYILLWTGQTLCKALFCSERDVTYSSPTGACQEQVEFIRGRRKIEYLIFQYLIPSVHPYCTGRYTSLTMPNFSK
jgi:hypothetical protein